MRCNLSFFKLKSKSNKYAIKKYLLKPITVLYTCIANNLYNNNYINIIFSSYIWIYIYMYIWIYIMKMYMNQTVHNVICIIFFITCYCLEKNSATPTVVTVQSCWDRVSCSRARRFRCTYVIHSWLCWEFLFFTSELI